MKIILIYLFLVIPIFGIGQNIETGTEHDTLYWDAAKFDFRTGKINRIIDSVYSDNWNNDSLSTASRNVIYDKMELLAAAGRTDTIIQDSIYIARVGVTEQWRDTIRTNGSGGVGHDAVTLSGLDYLTIANQVITVLQIDLTTDVTGLLPSANIGNHTHAASDISSGTFFDTRIAESNVTQHQAALSITESQISDLVHTTNTDTTATIIQDSILVYRALGVVTSRDTIRTAGGVGGANNYVNGMSFNVSDGILTLTRSGLGTLTQDLDGRYLESEVDGSTTNELQNLTIVNDSLFNSITLDTINLIPYLDNTNLTQNLSWVDGTNTIEITNGNNAVITGFADGTHTHTESDVTDLVHYTTTNHNTDFDTRLATKSTTNLAEGTNLYYTEIRVSANTDVANNTAHVTADADLSSTNEIQTLSITNDTLFNSISLDTINLLPYLDNTDAQNLTWTDGTNTVAISGGTDAVITGFADASHNHAATEITSGVLADAQIQQSNVTQHQAALSITESQISDLVHTTNTNLTTEQVQDITGAMTTLNTETLIAVTYQDLDGTLDFVVDNDLNNYDNTTSNFSTGAHYNTTNQNTDFDTRLATKSTTNLSEGTNLYYTEGRVTANSAVTANTAKATNVSTNLSLGTITATTIDVNSSDGTNVTLVEANTTQSGILGSDKWNEIVANTAAQHSIYVHPNHTGDVTSVADGVTTISSGAVDIAMLSATGTPTSSNFLRGDNTWTVPAGSGDMVLADAQTVTGAKIFNDTKLLMRNAANTFNSSFTNTNTADRVYTLQDASGTVAFTTDITGINSGTNTGDQTITLTGDVTGTGTGSFVATIGANKVVNSKLAQIATSTIKGRITASTGNVEDLTAANVRTIINVENGATADQTNSEIKSSYELNANTNAFTDANVTTLGNQSGTNTGDETQSSINALLITDVGTITTGVWNGTVLAEAYLQNQSGTNTGDELQATTTVVGVAEVGTVAEINTGSDDTKMISPLGLSGSQIQTDVTANNAKVSNANHSGDVTGSTALTIAADAVTFSKMQNIVAEKLLGSAVAGTEIQEITLGTNLAMSGSTLNATNTGEVNTMSSQGSGASIYYQKSASDLQLNAIKSENTKLTVALDGVTHDVELTVNEANIIHDNLSGFVANEHIDHSTVSVTAGTGLTGGGTIAATRTLNVIGGAGITANADEIILDLASNNTYTGQQSFNDNQLTDGATINWNLNTQQSGYVTLAANRTLANPTNIVDGGNYSLIIVQDATGSRTLTYGANYKFIGGVAPTLTTAANSVDILTCKAYSGNMHCTLLNDFK